ncbi:MAG: hypothetical protein F6J93_32690 [Oscillatoria sp. SIO1A7]|nr:hypothetical protein [Oscillatoria sp. SIO1A7]
METGDSTSQKDAGEKQKQYKIPGVPLAAYREMAAHLRQVRGVEVGLIPQHSKNFDYNQSQIAGLWIQSDSDMEPAELQRLEQILAYYGDRFGAWEICGQEGNR